MQPDRMCLLLCKEHNKHSVFTKATERTSAITILMCRENPHTCAVID